MRFVIFCRIPVTSINRTDNTCIILTEERTGIGIVNPSVQLALRFLHFQFHSIRIAFGIDDIGFQVVVHQELGTTTVIQVVLHLLVVTFQREFPHAVRGIVIESTGQLPSLLRLDVHIAQFPGICRTHDAGVAHLMDVLAHGIEPCLHREIIIERISTRQTELRTVISLQHLVARHANRIGNGTFRRQGARLVRIIITRSQCIEHGIADACIHGELWSNFPFFS